MGRVGVFLDAVIMQVLYSFAKYALNYSLTQSKMQYSHGDIEHTHMKIYRECNCINSVMHQWDEANSSAML